MSETEKKILETFKEVLPQMSKTQKSYLLGYGEALKEISKMKKAEEEETTEKTVPA